MKSRGDLKYVGGSIQDVGKHQAVLYKQLEHLQILVLVDPLKAASYRYQGMALFP